MNDFKLNLDIKFVKLIKWQERALHYLRLSLYGRKKVVSQLLKHNK